MEDKLNEHTIDILHNIETDDELKIKINDLQTQIITCEENIKNILIFNMPQINDNFVLVEEFLEDCDYNKKLLNNIYVNIQKIKENAINQIFVLKKIKQLKNYILLKEEIINIQYITNLYDELEILLKCNITKLAKKNKQEYMK
jgi:hypothetical protein